MKRALVASILGLTISTAAFGQGVVQFSNYTSTSYQQVMWGNDPQTIGALGSLAGKPITDPNVELQLFWALGNETGDTLVSFYSTANAGATTFINPGFSYNGGGYYAGPNQLLTGWTSSQTVTFGVEAWETAGKYGGATYATSRAVEESALWTETAAANANANGIQPSSNPAKSFNNGPPELTISIMPEPSPFALSSLSAAALLLIRRKKSLVTTSVRRTRMTTDH